MRERQHHSQKQGHDQEHDDGGGSFAQQKLGLALQNRQAERARETLHKHVDKVGQSMAIGATLFGMMVRSDDEKILQKKLHPDLGGKIADKLIDKIIGKLKDGLVAASDIGKAIASNTEKAFGIVKSYVDDKIKTTAQLTVVELAQHITAALIDKQLELTEQLHAAVDAIPRAKLLGVAQTLSPLQRAQPSEEDPDSPERGNLRDGLVNWALESLIGLPAGDLVGAEGIAMDAYAEFRAEVRSTLPVTEQADAIQHQLSHPNEPREKLDKVEDEKMGPKFKQDLDRDRTLRGRVEAATQ